MSSVRQGVVEVILSSSSPKVSPSALSESFKVKFNNEYSNDPFSIIPPLVISLTRLLFPLPASSSQGKSVSSYVVQPTCFLICGTTHPLWISVLWKAPLLSSPGFPCHKHNTTMVSKVLGECWIFCMFAIANGSET